MPVKADQPQVHAATPVDLGVIFVSLELSKSTWLVTAFAGERKDVSPYNYRRRHRRLVRVFYGPSPESPAAYGAHFAKAGQRFR